MKKIIYLTLLLMTLSFLSVALVSCGGPEVVSVEYDVAGGKLPTSAPASYEKGSEPDFSKVKPTKKNYDFEGWYLDAEFKNKFSADLVTGTSVKLYAKWDAEDFDIEYVLGGGECDGLPDEYTYGTELSLVPYVPERSGYIFGGWYFDEDCELSASVIEDDMTDDVTVYAKWTRAPQKIADIPAVSKGYFGSGSSALIKISDYVNTNGLEVTYAASVSDPTVASAQISGDYLKLDFLKASGETSVTLSVSYGDTEYVTTTFNAKPVVYSKIACVGDSLTAGHTFPIDETYPSLLQGLLGSDVEVRNFGKNGASVTEYSNLGAYVTHSEYQASLEFNADVVIIMLGTNDARLWDQSGSVYKSEYISLVNSYKAVNPDVKIVVATSPQVLSGNTLNIPNENIVNKLYPMQLEIAAEIGATVVDFHATLAELSPSAMYRDDDVHITRAAALELAALIKETI